MSSLITNATIQIRRDTAGNFTSNNPTPAAGEWCKEIDTGKMKNGDGSTAWNDLDYSAIPNPATVGIYTTNNDDWLLNEIGGTGVGKWNNVHLGDDPTQDSNVNHVLDAPLSDLIVKIFISTDGTDANAFEILNSSWNDASTFSNIGHTIFQTSTDVIKIQTGSSGMGYIRDSDGNFVPIVAQDWYYKIKVYKLS